MNKNILTALLTVCAFSAMLLLAQVATNLIFLHEQTKSTRSNSEHLHQFTATGNVILKFYADWCNPCKRMSPLFEHAAQTFPNYTFIKINRDFFGDLTQEFNVKSIPTLIFLRDGKEIGRYNGGPLTKIKMTELIGRIYS